MAEESSYLTGEPLSAQEVTALHAASSLSRTWVEANLPTQQIEEIRQLATGVFEDSAKAAKWLQRPNVATHNKSPISLLGTPEGYEHVKELLMRIEYGNLA